MHRESKNNSVTAGKYIRAESFQAVNFFNVQEQRQVIVLYSLGEDGIVREFNGKQWLAFPILADDTAHVP